MGWAEQDTSVRCAVSWYAPTDIFRMYEQLTQSGKNAFSCDDPSSPEARYLGGSLNSLPAGRGMKNRILIVYYSLTGGSGKKFYGKEGICN